MHVRSRVVTGLLGLLALAALLVGCATKPVPLDQAGAARIHKIALIPIREPEVFLVTNVGGAAALFGVIGGAIQGSNNNDRSKQYTQAIKGMSVQIAAALSAPLVQGLQAKGLEVTVLEGQYPKVAADGKSDDFSQIHTDADAILLVWFGYTGYWSGSFETGYHPWEVVAAKLLDANSKDILFRQNYSAWREPANQGTRYVDMHEKVGYASFDELLASAKDSAVPLEKAPPEIARQLLADLKLGAAGN